MEEDLRPALAVAGGSLLRGELHVILRTLKTAPHPNAYSPECVERLYENASQANPQAFSYGQVDPLRTTFSKRQALK